MYLQPPFRGLGLGKQMIKEAIQIGTDLRYHKMRLDTLSTMKSAISIYQKYGFHEIAPYRKNPIKGALYFEKDLH